MVIGRSRKRVKASTLLILPGYAEVYYIASSVQPVTHPEHNVPVSVAGMRK